MIISLNHDSSYHRASETFLQRLMSIYVSAHYRNTPNDLQMLSDAPAHHLFCLLGPVDPNSNALPEILCVVQVEESRTITLYSVRPRDVSRWPPTFRRFSMRIDSVIVTDLSGGRDFPRVRDE